MKKFFSSKYFRIGFFCVSFGVISFGAYFSIFAAPPASPYAPGQTLNPACNPGDTNCTVSAPLVTLNNLSTSTQYFASSTSGSDFSIGSSGSTHTFYLPSASASNRGLLTSGDWTIFNNKLSTSTGLTVSNFTSPNISQWTNNANYATTTIGSVLQSISASNPITYNTSTGAIGWINSNNYISTSTGLTTANFATSSISQWNNNSGYLTSAITSLNGLVASSQLFATSSAGSGFDLTSSGSTHTLRIGTASGSNNGLLTSTDWNTFNNKTSSQWTTTSTGIFYNSGNVGIGTTNPGEKLEVSGNLKFTGAGTIKTGSGDLVFQPTSRNVALWDGTNNYNLQIYSGNTQTVNLAGSGASYITGGNVGIGNVSPSSTLHVSGSFQVGASNLYVSSTSGNVGIGTASPASQGLAAGQALHILGVLRAQDFRGGSLTSVEISGGSNIYNPYIAVDQNNPLTFITGGSERVRLTSTGNVGIGNVSPSSTLHVSGTLISTATTTLASAGGSVLFPGSGVWNNQGNVGIGTASPQAHLEVTGYSNFTGTMFIGGQGTNPYPSVLSISAATPNVKLYLGGGTSQNGMYWDSAGGGHGYYVYDDATSFHFYDNTSSKDVFTFDLSQNVTIPNGNLIVGGTAITTIKGNGALSTFGGAFNASGTISQNGTPVLTSAITSLNGLVASSQLFATSSSGSGFDLTSSGSTHTLKIGTASGSNNGLLTSTDWNTFNNKTSSQWTTTSTGIFYNSGNVGIGTASPNDKLNIDGGGLTFTTNSVYANAVSIRKNSDAMVFSGGTSGYYFNKGDNSLTLVTIQNGGNVGIGTTNPLSKLDLSDTAGVNGLTVGYTGGINFTDRTTSVLTISYPASSGVTWFNSQGFDAGFKSNSSNNTLYLKNGGNVGIGTSNPSSRLEIQGGNLVVGGTATSTLKGDGALSTFGGAFNASGTISQNGTPVLTSAITSLNGLVASSQLFATSSSGSGFDLTSSVATHTLRIGTASGSNNGLLTSTDWNTFNNKTSSQWTTTSTGIFYNSGNVGIGTTSPTQKLDVNGQIRVPTGNAFVVGSYNGIWDNSGTIMMASDKVAVNVATGNVGIGNVSPSSTLHIQGASGSNTVFRMTSYTEGGTTNQNAQLTYSGTGDNSLNIATNYSGGTGNFISFSPGGTERVRFQQDGNVGIGTASPGYPLNLYKASSETGLALDWGATRVYLSHGGWSMGAGKFGIGGPASPALTVDTTTGNVGIGTSTPNARLNVLGSTNNSSTAALNIANASATSLLYVRSDGNVGIGTTGPQGKLHIDSGNTGVPLFLGTLNAAANTSIIDLRQLNAGGAGGISGPLITIDNRGNNPTFYSSNNGSNPFIINSSGNVGIGTSTPTYKLDISAGNVDGVRVVSSNSPSIRLDATGGGGMNWAIATKYSAANLFEILYGGSGAAPSTSYLAINSNGNVGIGNVSPSSTLHVSGSFQVGANNLYVSSTSGNVGIGTTNPGAKLDVVVGNNGLIRLGTDSASGVNFVNGSILGQASQFQIAAINSLPISFYTGATANSMTAGTERMRLSSAGGLSLGNSYVGTDAGAGNMIITGNVGIGTSTPGAALEISNNISSYTPIEILRNTNISGYATRLAIAAHDYGQIGFFDEAVTDFTGNPAFGFSYDTQNNKFSMKQGPNTRLLIDNNGNVGIGNVSPSSTLHVSGTLISTATTTLASAGGSVLFPGSGVWNNQGNVGIGTTNPGAKLDIQGANGVNSFIIRNTDGSIGMKFLTGGSGGGIIDTADAGGTVRNRIYGAGDSYFTSGNVGIGTSTPNARLNVLGSTNNSSTAALNIANASATSLLYVRSDGNVGIGTTAPNYTLKISGAPDADGSIATVFDATASATVSSFGGLRLESNPGNDVILGKYTHSTGAANDWNAFQIRSTYGGGTTLMSVDMNTNAGHTVGNVGIGNVSPSSTLHVSGTLISTATTTLASAGGNVGIGTTGPVMKFQVQGSGEIINAGLRGGAATDTYLYVAEHSGASPYMSVGSYLGDVSGPAALVLQSGGGNVGIGVTIPGAQLDLSTDSARKLTTTAWTTGSDIRIKTNVQSIGDALDIIGRVRPVKFHYTPDFLAAHPSVKDTDYYNFIAQEYQQVFPDSVTQGSDGLLYLNSSNMTPYAIAGIKELNTKVSPLYYGISVAPGLATTTPFMNIDLMGNVGIGTSTPALTLHVASTTTGAVARFTNSNGYCDINPTNTALECTSDERMKKDIMTFGNALNIVDSLRGVNFRWNSETEKDQKHYGFIAQEVERVIPELVTTDLSSGIKSVNYMGFAPVLTEAIKELSAKVNKLEMNSQGNVGAVVNISSSGMNLASILDVFKQVGIEIANGIIKAKEFIAEKITAKKVVTEALEIKDSATGEIYCVKISNGDWQKIKGECNSQPITGGQQQAGGQQPEVNSQSVSTTSATTSVAAEVTVGATTTAPQQISEQTNAAISQPQTPDTSPPANEQQSLPIPPPAPAPPPPVSAPPSTPIPPPPAPAVPSDNAAPPQ